MFLQAIGLLKFLRPVGLVQFWQGFGLKGVLLRGLLGLGDVMISSSCLETNTRSWWFALKLVILIDLTSVEINTRL